MVRVAPLLAGDLWDKKGKRATTKPKLIQAFREGNELGTTQGSVGQKELGLKSLTALPLSSKLYLKLNHSPKKQHLDLSLEFNNFRGMTL